jgi:MFS family permease
MRTEAALPKPFLVWLSGALASQLGDAALYFALGWAASAHGGNAAALVLTAANLPRCILLLVGGVIGDRVGARRVMIAGDAVMLGVTLVLAVAVHGFGASLWLLLVLALVMGSVDAFYLPASGSMPRLLAEGPSLPRALALRQAGSQAITLFGAPLGGLLVGLFGLIGAASVDSATFAVVLGVLIAIRPSISAPAMPERRGIAREALDGVRVAGGDPVLRYGLILLAAAAGCLLPVTSLLIPLLARSHGWSAGQAGLVVGAQSLGGVSVSLLVARFGRLTRPGLVAPLALLGSALGFVALAWAPNPAIAAASVLVSGMFTGVFVSHLGPLMLTAAPQTYLSRIQAVIALVQTTTLLVMNNVLGTLAHTRGPAQALVVCAVILAGAAALACSSRSASDHAAASRQSNPPIDSVG